MFRRRSQLGWPVRLFAAGPVGSALVLSFANLADLARASRIEGWLAYLWPVTLDATGVVATLIWLNPGMPNDARRSAMRLALAAIIVSILGNSLMHWLLDSGQRPHVIIQMIVAGAVPPSVLFMMLHVLHQAIRPGQPASDDQPGDQQPETASQPEPARPTPADDRAPATGLDTTRKPDSAETPSLATVTATAARADQASQPDQIGPASQPGQTHLAIPPGQPAASPTPAKHRAAGWRTHIDAAGRIVASQPDIGRLALARELDVPESQARKLLAHLAGATTSTAGED